MQRASRSTASRIRIAILLSLLLLVALYAAHDFYSRRERTAWRRTLNVALVIVEQGQVAPAALDALRARVPALEQRLKDEFRRYRPGAPAPFAFVVFGAVPLGTPPPKPPSEGALELVRHAIDVFRFTRDTDRRALVPTRGFDARLYLVVRPPASAEQAFVEGASEQGGRVGIARCELDDEMADLALFVAAHELFHTLNASDKYDSAGRTRIPEGLAEPERVPPLPQAYAEVMARNRPLDAVNEVPPTSLAELRVGPLTASEVGWSAPRGAAP